MRKRRSLHCPSVASIQPTSAGSLPDDICWAGSFGCGVVCGLGGFVNAATRKLMAIAVIVFMLNACILLGLGWALKIYVVEGNAVLDTSAQMKSLSKHQPSDGGRHG